MSAVAPKVEKSLQKSGGLSPETRGLPPESERLPSEAGKLPPEAGGLPPGSERLSPEIEMLPEIGRGDALLADFLRARADSEAFCAPLHIEDYGLQAMPETSPPKWHLAHTTWFFETFVLKAHCDGYAPAHPAFEVLFNSYYNGIGEQHPRPERGLLSRPTLAEVMAYRRQVTDAVADLLAQPARPAQSQPAHQEWQRMRELAELGIHHERQHQELFYTDIKYSLSRNPLHPALEARQLPPAPPPGALRWREYPGGEAHCGHPGAPLREQRESHRGHPGAPPCEQRESHRGGFCFDNEQPRHGILLQPYALAARLATNGEFLEFMEDGGYQRPELWLADGWAMAQERKWNAPLYWFKDGDQWREYTLHGDQPLDLNRPVCHVSAYEADAYARWAGYRLPTEFEWEAAAQVPDAPANPLSNPFINAGQFIDKGELHPQGAAHSSTGQPARQPGTVPASAIEAAQFTGAATAPSAPQQLYGYCWQWTSSAYGPYPGYRPAPGAVGEYNGKFMANQLVLRGGSCVTSRDHIRPSYRNFFYPADRWQFTGIRLARWP